MLVRQNAFTAARRTASIAAPVLLSVSFAMLIGGMVRTSTAAYAARRTASGSVTAAARLGLSPGESVELVVANGQTVPVTVTGVSEAQSADFVVARDWVPSNDIDALTEAVLLSSVPAGPAYAAEADAAEDRLVWTFTLLLIAMACGFSVLAVANTLLMAGFARRRELATLSRAGATREQLRRLLAAETVLVVLLGTVLGVPAALPALLAIRSGLAAQDRPPGPPRNPMAPPGRRNQRLPPRRPHHYST